MSNIIFYSYMLYTFCACSDNKTKLHHVWRFLSNNNCGGKGFSIEFTSLLLLWAMILCVHNNCNPSINETPSITSSWSCKHHNWAKWPHLVYNQEINITHITGCIVTWQARFSFNWRFVSFLLGCDNKFELGRMHKAQFAQVEKKSCCYWCTAKERSDKIWSWLVG